MAVALHSTALSVALQESRLSIVAAREEERRQAPARPARRPRPGADRDRVQGRRGAQHPDPRAGAGRPAPGRDADRHHDRDRRHPPARLRPAAAVPRRPRADRFPARAVPPGWPGEAGASVLIRIDVPNEPAALAAAVEVAAYRIITEAMTNATGIPRPRRSTVSLTLAEGTGLTIEVTDDGPAPPGEWRPGSGWPRCGNARLSWAVAAWPARTRRAAAGWPSRCRGGLTA